MANAFSKEERVAFESILEGFQDALVLSRNVNIYRTDATSMERSNNTIWRPMPYIAQSFSGTDMTSNFTEATQLSVPAQINISKSVPWTMSANDLNDALQEDRLGDSAKQKLASDINVSVMNLAVNQGTLVVPRATAATGFDDIAQCEAIMNEQGVEQYDRFLALSTRDYNGMASNLAARETMGGIVSEAYKRAMIPKETGAFTALKLDYANSLTAAGGSTVSVNGANQYHTPLATSTAATGETSNVDNRSQNLSITVGSGTVAVGDCFTIAGVNAVHHITKQDTGQLKTFRIKSIVSGGGGTGVVEISPAIISGQGGTDAELQYQNVTATPADGAVITFLNTTTAAANPFWKKDAIELLPGRYAVPTDAGAAVMRASTDQGLEVVMQKFYDINTMTTKFRLDTFYGVTMCNPEMAGILLFGQV